MRGSVKSIKSPVNKALFLAPKEAIRTEIKGNATTEPMPRESKTAEKVATDRSEKSRTAGMRPAQVANIAPKSAN